ncbi:MAG: hypothetical protein ABSF14_05635 [Terriglobia bacterium]|jgi:hypothetical protein
MAKPKVAPRLSDESVKAKTGKAWAELFAILDKAGARKWDHQAMVAFLHKRYAPGPWWEQMVTVTYEQVRGLRKPHEKLEGYEISRSKTFARPLAALYDAWEDPEKRCRWLKDASFTIRKAARLKSLRFTWVDGQTQVVAGFYSKGGARSQVAVQHSKLPSAPAAAHMKAYWTAQLAKLQGFLEG